MISHDLITCHSSYLYLTSGNSSTALKILLGNCSKTFRRSYPSCTEMEILQRSHTFSNAECVLTNWRDIKFTPPWSSRKPAKETNLSLLLSPAVFRIRRPREFLIGVDAYGDATSTDSLEVTRSVIGKTGPKPAYNIHTKHPGRLSHAF